MGHGFAKLSTSDFIAMLDAILEATRKIDEFLFQSQVLQSKMRVEYVSVERGFSMFHSHHNAISDENEEEWNIPTTLRYREFVFL